MHSDESIEPRYVNHPSAYDTGANDTSQASADEAWRAEVASRVCNYRARRKRRSAVDDSAVLDFGPAAGAQSFETQSFGTQSVHSPLSQSMSAASHATSGRVAAQGAGNPAQPGRHAIDTNYYRRLNAESMAQGSAVLMGATVAATAPDQEQEFEFEERSEASTERKSDDTVLDVFGDQPAKDPTPGDASLDLEIRPTVAADSPLDRYCISEPAPEPEPPTSPMLRNQVQGNLIVFPRALMEPPLVPQPSRDELAEPMDSRPRILEVPEDIMPIVQGSLFPEIRLDYDVEEGASSRKPEIEVPLQVAPVSARLMAGLTDCGVVMAAGGLFAAMACRALPGIPHAKPFWMMLGATTLLLWAVYQFLFLLYAGRTLGMSMRGIRLSTFDGGAPQWKQRSRRARFIFISFAAAAMGFLWALVDEDELCWHDRISRTFPTTE